MTQPTEAQMQAAFLAAKRFGKILDDDVLAAIIAAGTAEPAVTIERSKLVNCQPGQRDPGWLYQTTGPDGTRFDNRSIVELRSTLRRKYGKTLKINEPWKAAAR